jgi:UDP-N-acetylglucosamine 2-epimerase
MRILSAVGTGPQFIKASALGRGIGHLKLSRGLRLLQPVSYLDTVVPEDNTKVIVTDPGGVQKEAYFYRVPCVTLREETEWLVTVQSGWNVLAGADEERISRLVTCASKPSRWQNHRADGHAAEQMFDILLSTCLKSPQRPGSVSMSSCPLGTSQQIRDLCKGRGTASRAA